MPGFFARLKSCFVIAFIVTQSVSVKAFDGGLERQRAGERTEAQERIRTGTQAYRDGDYLQAERDLRLAVVRLRAADGPQSDTLIDPQALLGLTLQELGKHDEAIEELTRAQHLVHLHGGLLDPAQIDFIRAKLDSLEELEEYWIAEQSFYALVKVHRENYGIADHRTIMATAEFGRWQTEIGLYRSAISFFRESILELEALNGGAHVGMIPYYIGRGQAYLAEYSQRDRGITNIGRAIDVMHEVGHAVPIVEQVSLLMYYGDVLMRFRREKPAVDQYQQAFDIVQANPDFPDRARWLERFHQPRWVSPGAFSVKNDPASDEDIVIEYSINADGRPVNVNVTSPYNRTVEHVLRRRFEITRFQPAFTANGPMYTHNQIRRVALDGYRDWTPTPEYEPIFGL